MLEYDLVGFHVQSFLDNYVHCCRRQLGATWDSDRLTARNRRQAVGVYPIGIDPEAFLPQEPEEAASRHRGELARVVRGRRLILGVDRLDFTKGIPERIEAFAEFLRREPDWRKKVSFIQIAAPSRAGVPLYAQLRARTESVVGRVNAEMAEHDWVPVRYLYRTYSRKRLARFYREAAVGLVTPLRDGMNLVAKEFVAAQRQASPGVLVLSRTAGAAEELPEALIVNPYVAADVAAGIGRALAMPVQERRRRHASLLARVLGSTASEWSRQFLEDLAGVENDPMLEAVAEIERKDILSE
jgi:trehalose 6-phosphate synthase